MTEADLRVVLERVLEPYGDPKATAEVLALAVALPFDGDINNYARDIAATALTVWERKLAAVEARVQAAEAEMAIVLAAQLMPESRYVH